MDREEILEWGKDPKNLAYVRKLQKEADDAENAFERDWEKFTKVRRSFPMPEKGSFAYTVLKTTYYDAHSSGSSIGHAIGIDDPDSVKWDKLHEGYIAYLDDDSNFPPPPPLT